jgi:hypothetical protein
VACDHCQHVLQLNVEHEIDRLRGEFRAREKDLLEMIVSRINQIGMLEHKVENLTKIFNTNLQWQDEKTSL